MLLATTAVPLWARSRSVLGPVFVCTAAASGAAATRLALVAGGMPEEHPTQAALGHVETASILAELALSAINRRRLRELGDVMHAGRPGACSARRSSPSPPGSSTAADGAPAHPAHPECGQRSLSAGALTYRYAWVEGGKASAAKHSDAAAMGRGTHSLEDLGEVPRSPRMESKARRPRRLGALTRIWSEVVRRVSLAAERLLRL